MKKFMFTVGTAILMAIGSVSPVEPEIEDEPYMAVHRSAEVEKPIEKPVLWGADRITEGKTEKTTEYSENDILLMERVTMSESSIEPYEGKVMVAKTIINRAKLNNQTIEEVVYAPYQYSVADNGFPTEEVKKAVQDSINNDTTYPEDMIYFREGGYHEFGSPYMHVGNHYFSCK